MDAEHKAKLAQGRNDARAVKNYLEFLETHKPKRGRKRTAETINRRLQTIEETLEEAGVLQRLAMIQEQEDLADELAALQDQPDGSEFEAAFVDAAGRYAAAKGLSRGSFRQMGVSADVLRRAGV